ncbi:MAG: alpha/beta hydrolase [Acidobacteriota bacterium]
MKTSQSEPFSLEDANASEDSPGVEADQSRSAVSDNPDAVSQEVKPPSLGYLLLEGRALGELLTTYAVMPALKRGPRGDGHPVLVLPGFLATDLSTRPLRSFLEDAGYAPHAWKLGRNYGPRNGLEERLMDRLLELRERYQRPVSLIGWSLGGIYARLLANRSPEDVRCVITLGTPFNAHTKANRSWKLFEWMSGRRIDDIDPLTFSQVRDTPPVPTTSVYSLTDGIVAWRSSLDQDGPRVENIQVPGSHIGLGANPLALHVILDRLAQPEGEWRRFERSGWKKLFYPNPKDAAGATEPSSNGHGASDVTEFVGSDLALDGAQPSEA